MKKFTDIDLLAPLSNETFRRLFFAQTIALIGTGLTTVALGLLAYRLDPTEADKVLGLAMAIKMVAYLTVAPVAATLMGWLSSKTILSPKYWLIGLNIGRGLAVLALFFATEIWQLLIIIFCLNAMAACYTPLYQSILPAVLPDEKSYTQSLALSQFAMEAETLLSPTLAALVLLVLPFDTLFLLNAGAFMLMASILVPAQLPKGTHNERSGSLWKRLSFGVYGYLKTPRLRATLAMNLVLSCGGAMVIINTVVLVKERLSLSDSEVPLLLLAAGIGAMTAAFVVPRVIERIGQRILMLSASSLMFVALLSGALVNTWFLHYTTLFPLWFLLGASNAAILIPSANVIRQSCQESDRNDFFAANFSLTHGMWLFAYLLAGIGGSSLNMTWVFIIFAGISLIALLYAKNTWVADEIIDPIHTHEAIEHDHWHTHDEHHQHDHNDGEHENLDPLQPHCHQHRHEAITHRHVYLIDEHHWHWIR